MEKALGAVAFRTNVRLVAAQGHEVGVKKGDARFQVAGRQLLEGRGVDARDESRDPSRSAERLHDGLERSVGGVLSGRDETA